MADFATMRRRSRLRWLSVAVLVVVSGLAVAGCLITRNVVSDQENKLLKQRADEAGLYLSTAISPVQTELASLAASAAATDKSPAAFAQSTKLLTADPNGFSTVALVDTGTPPSIIASTGTGLESGLGDARSTAITTAEQKIGFTGALVATRLFKVGDASRLGFAYASPSLPGALIYAETAVQTTSPATTQGQPFSELVAAVYAVPRVEQDQLVAVSGSNEKLPLSGKTVSVKSPVGQGDPWLLVAKARHPLVGSVATWTPWVLLAAGLVAALLATAIVETVARRREYALGLVKVRTEELQQSLSDLANAHEQLVRQERLAAIGQLASTVGHELRNPLGVISNAVYLLRGDLGPEPTPAGQRHLATAEREVSAATVIVSDLLEFAREREPVVDDVDVTGLVDEVLAILPPPTGVSVERTGDSHVTARGDREMLRQVLLNIIGNGYQAMPDGGRLTVDASMAAGAVRIHVADTGVGMTAEAQERLFEPFFTTKPRGVGLGLAVTKRIVEAHNGTITASSKEGAGTDFTVLLPVIVSPRNGADEPATQEAQS
ncbi:MAG TPA: ATP-binding protein [Mycobacteriales bacterium]|nr:ATP-binding protein [Mycobacteriales bacterium]